MTNTQHAQTACRLVIEAMEQYAIEHELDAMPILVIASIGLCSGMIAMLADHPEQQARYAKALETECRDALQRNTLKDYQAPAHGWRLN